MSDGVLGRCVDCKASCLTEFCPSCRAKRDTKASWEGVVVPEIKRNNYPRMNWKGVLGMSLTRAVARFKAAGMSAEQTIKAIEFENDLTDEAKRRLRIGVCARFGEMGTAQSELKKVKKNVV